MIMMIEQEKIEYTQSLAPLFGVTDKKKTGVGIRVIIFWAVGVGVGIRVRMLAWSRSRSRDATDSPIFACNSRA